MQTVNSWQDICNEKSEANGQNYFMVDHNLDIGKSYIRLLLSGMARASSLVYDDIHELCRDISKLDDWNGDCLETLVVKGVGSVSVEPSTW